MLRFLDERPREKPFFAWVSFAEPHTPAQAPAPYFDLFPPEALPAPAAGPEVLADKGPRYVFLRSMWESVMRGDLQRRMLRANSNYCGMLRLIDDQPRRLLGGLSERGLEENTVALFLSDHGDYAGEYGLIRKGGDLPEVLCRIPMIWRGPGIAARGALDGAMVANLDDNIGRLMDAVERLGLERNTLIVFTSDHGELFGAHGRRAKNIFYDEAVRVPFFLRYPGVVPNGACETPLNTVDIMPTLLSLMGLPIPREVQGRDASAYLIGRNPEDKLPGSLMMGTGATACFEDGHEWRAWRDERYT